MYSNLTSVTNDSDCSVGRKFKTSIITKQYHSWFIDQYYTHKAGMYDFYIHLENYVRQYLYFLKESKAKDMNLNINDTSYWFYSSNYLDYA